MSDSNTLLSFFLAAVITVGIVVVALGAALVVAQRRRTGLQRNYAQRLLAAQEEERARVAREVHDDALQRVAMIRHELDGLRLSGLGPGDPEGAHRLGAIATEVADLGVMLRSVAHQLHPSMLGETGLANALEVMAAEFQRLEGLEVELDLQPDAGRVSADAAIAVYRIAQEALRNVIRHARVRRATLRLTSSGQSLVARIHDGGVGFTVADRPGNTGLGLIAMRERAGSAGGSVTVTSAPGAGTTVEAVFPLTMHA